jgi:hypothetical protein
MGNLGKEPDLLPAVFVGLASKQPNRAFLRLHKSKNNIQQSGFAAAIRTDDTEYFTGIAVKVNGF